EGRRPAGGPAGVDRREAYGSFRFQLFGVLADDRLRKERQAAQVAQRRDRAGIEIQPPKQIPVVRNVRLRIREKPAETIELETFELVALPPLRRLEPRANAHGRMALHPLLQRKNDS